MDADPITKIRERMDYLATLEDGWLDGEGRGLPEEGCAWASSFLCALVADGMEKPHLFPTESGGLSCEWDSRGRRWGLDAEIDLTTKRAELMAIDFATPPLQATEDVTIDLSTPEGAKAFFEFFTKARPQ